MDEVVPWGSALLMAVALSCTLGLLLDGPKVLIAPAIALPVILIVLGADKRVSFYSRAEVEYCISIAEFESLGLGGLPVAMKVRG